MVVCAPQKSSTLLIINITDLVEAKHLHSNERRNNTMFDAIFQNVSDLVSNIYLNVTVKKESS